jgi:peptide-methionine (S)-S-oxide reductase
MSNNNETTTLAGGCFWCLEAVYELLAGVSNLRSGFSGGHVPNPSYQQVISKASGHAEVVQFEFDPDVISYREILEIFFTIHDPTTPNRQGNDVGPQYRSAIFYHDDAQRETAEQIIEDFATQLWDNPIVTEVKAFDVFYEAEGYHQQYFQNNRMQPYCQVIIQPKVAKVRQIYLEKLADRPAVS